MRLADGLGGARQAIVAVYQVRGNGAVGTLRRECGAHARHDDQRCGAQRPHASPPARSASGGFERDPGLRPSIFLYHEINAAAAHIMAMPRALTRTWTITASDSSLKTKCPANDRKIPRQKISRECCPHRMAGRNQTDCNPGQSEGMKRIVSAARARKCVIRNTSRLILSIGYRASLNHLGT